MFELIKKQVNLIEVLEKDLSVSFRQMGDKNWVIDGDKTVESCPFCGHHDCFRVHYVEGDNQSAFYKCFSCSEQGDVVTWISKRRGLTLSEAIRAIAKEYDIDLPKDTNPIQQIFTLAADYYHACLMESQDKPNPILNGLTPLRYQLEVRKRHKESITKFKIGFSDGGLASYLDSLGIDKELLEQSGLISLKTGKDYLPANCFIYPHFVKGRVSHFTFKDPTKRVQYQLPKKYSINGYLFYGQDSVQNFNSVALVEGENDWLAVVEAGGASVLATIGQLSVEQIEWLKSYCYDKKIITLFDPDEAGDKYREKIELIRKHFPAVVHVLPPNGKDIDELLTTEHSLVDIIKNNQVKVAIKVEKKVTPALPWEDLGVEGQAQSAPTPDLGEGMTLVGPKSEPEKYQPPTIPQDESSVEQNSNLPAHDDVVQIDDGGVILTRGCYYKVVIKDDKTNFTRISNFFLELKNIYIDEETSDRRRELVLHRCDGFKSKPFELDSDTKVSLTRFKTLMAKVADGEWSGREPDLDNMWRLIYSQYPEVIIEGIRQVGRSDKNKFWVFKNVLITDSGRQIMPDESGVFWTQGKSKGYRLKSITESNDYDGLPSLNLDLTREQADELLIDFVHRLARIFKNYGQALMCVGWIQSNLFSNEIFKADNGFGSLMIWGSHGAGKSSITKWLQMFFGMNEMGKTSIQQLRGGVGFMRKAAYYSSLPLFLDEVRANDETSQYLGMIRSWYDREGRVISKEKSDVRIVPIKSTLMMAGEDLPDDPATRQRCIMLRLENRDNNDMEVQKKKGADENFVHLNDVCDMYSGITYHWLLDYVKTDKKKVIEGIKFFDKKLVEAGCSNRTSKVWASSAYFASKLGEVICPDFDFIGWVVQAGEEEQQEQKSSSALYRFFEDLASIRSLPNSPITDEHYTIDDNVIHLWFAPIYKIVHDQTKEKRRQWTKLATLKAIKEEPYFIDDKKKVAMGLNAHRVVALSLDLNKCPEPLREMCNYTNTCATQSSVEKESKKDTTKSSTNGAFI